MGKRIYGFQWSIIAICFAHFDEFDTFLFDLIKVIRCMGNNVGNAAKGMEVLELSIFKLDLLFRWVGIVKSNNKRPLVVFSSRCI